MRSELGKLDNGDNNHTILSDTGGFLQTATTGGGFMLEYRDGSGYFGSRNEQIPLAQVQEAFARYLAGDGSWKSSFEWDRREEGQSAGSPGQSAGSPGQSAGSPGQSAGSAGQSTGATGVGPNPLDGLVNSVKNEAVRFAKRKLRGLFRR